MKCDKCGFVSFDYLSECRRCGADLTGIREQLGFSTLKSDVPFLLGALLQGGGRSQSLMNHAGTEREDTEGQDISRPDARELSKIETGGEEPVLASGQNAGVSPPTQDELIIELSEADLESLAGTSEPGRGKEPRKGP